MKKRLILSFTGIVMVGMLYAQWPNNVTVIDLGTNSSGSVQGDLAKGAPMEDLSWAWNSANACFTGIQAKKYKGNHVFFAVTMPARCEMKIRVTPSDPNGDLSIYAYRIGNDEYNIVPDLERCITCEADYKWDRPFKGKTQTSERWVEFSNPGTEIYNIVIGVSGPAEATKGTFEVKVELTK